MISPFIQFYLLSIYEFTFHKIPDTRIQCVWNGNLKFNQTNGQKHIVDVDVVTKQRGRLWIK